MAEFSRIRIDLDLLKVWLIEEKSWSSNDAEWCVRRIETGLAVLEVYKGS